MSSQSGTAESRPTAVTVSFAERYAASGQFDAVYKRGMELVERTAAYLSGPGRKEARLLKPPVSLVYATESMRLTTRLLELASWLLIRRALRDGDISREEARVKRARVSLRGGGRPAQIAHFDELPPTLRQLIEESFVLTDRIVQLDKSLQEPSLPQRNGDPNPVAAKIAALRAAFAAVPR
jgi:regulator of CtrA degradation